MFRTVILILALGSLMACKHKNLEKGKNVGDASNLEVPIRYMESYGSVCCPKDPKHDNPLKIYVEAFEAKHKVDIKEVYRVIKGREGEQTLYLTLKELDAKQRVVFVKERLASFKNPLDEVQTNLANDLLKTAKEFKTLLRAPWNEAALKGEYTSYLLDEY